MGNRREEREGRAEGDCVAHGNHVSSKSMAGEATLDNSQGIQPAATDKHQHHTPKTTTMTYMPPGMSHNCHRRETCTFHILRQQSRNNASTS